MVADPRDRNIPTTFSADLQRHGGEETWRWGEILCLRTVIVAAVGGGRTRRRGGASAFEGSGRTPVTGDRDGRGSVLVGAVLGLSC